MGSAKIRLRNAKPATVVISNLSPVVEGGRFPTKRVVDEPIAVEADVFKDGHDQVVVVVGSRKKGKKKWQEVPMHLSDNDRWHADLSFDRAGQYEICVTAWADDFLTWLHDFERRLTGDQDDFTTEIEEGRLGQRAVLTEHPGDAGLIADDAPAAVVRR